MVCHRITVRCSMNQNNDKYERSNKRGTYKFRYKHAQNKHNKYQSNSDNKRSLRNDNKHQNTSRHSYYRNNQNFPYYQNRQKIWSYPPHRSQSSQEVYSDRNVSDGDRGSDLPLPGSEAERSSKIELDKKRIKEALSSVDTNNDNINTILTNDTREKLNKFDKPNDYVPLQELCLTPSDYKDIGSVDTSQVDADAEGGDGLLNLGSYKDPKSSVSQPSTSSRDKAKPLQSGGWRVGDFIDMETVPSPSIQPHHLNNININSPSCNKFVSRNADSQDIRFKGMISSADRSRIDRLYRSFLKSRLSRTSDKISSVNKRNSCKDNQSNSPLTSAGGKCTENASLQKHDECEIEMPLPLQIKIEAAERNCEYEQHGENLIDTEADEFYKEFSHLLVHPDYLIPSDVLEKLGLQDLLEMNLSVIKDKNHINSEKMEKRHCDSQNNKPQTLQNVKGKSKESVLRVKSVDALNMTNNRTDMHVSSTLVETHLASSTHSTPLTRVLDTSGSSSSGPLIQAGADEERQCQELRRETSTPKCRYRDQDERTGSLASGELNSSNTAVLESTCVCSKNEKIVTTNNVNQVYGDTGKNTFHTSSGTDEPLDIKLDISSRILRLFVIDKQIQELMEEKTKVYDELLSQKEIASTLFNSWADNQLKQQRSVVNSDSQQISKSSKLVKQICSVIDTSRTHEQSKNSQIEVVSSSSLQLRSESDGEMSNVSKNCIDGNCKITCATISKLIGNVKETLTPVKSEMVDDVLNLYDNYNNSNDQQQNTSNKIDSKSLDHQSVYNKSLKNVSHSEIKQKTSATSESDSENILQGSRELNKKNFVRESEHSSIKSVYSSSDKRKHVCGEKCVIEGCSVKVRNKKRKRMEDAVDLIDFINLDTDSNDSDVIETGVVITTPKISPVSKPSTSTSDSLPKCKSKEVIKEFENPRKPILCLKVSGKFCYAGNRDGDLLKYFVNTGEIVTTLKGHTAGINSVILYRKLVITGSCDNTIRCFSAETDKQLYCNEIGCPVQCMDERNGLLYAGTKFGYVFIFSLQKESVIPVGEPLNLTDCNILAIKAAKEGARNIIIVAARGQPITVRDATTGLLLRSFTWCATVYCLQLFRESPLVYCGTNSKSVVVTDFTTGETKFDCNIGKGVVQIIFAHGLMFTACYDGNVYVYDVQAETLVASIAVCKQMLLCMDILKNKIIVSTSGSEVKSIPFPGIVKKYIKGTLDSVSNVSM